MRRRAILRRRLVALLITAGATALIWMALVRDDDAGGNDPAASAAVDDARIAGLLERLSSEQEIDQLMLVGFEGTPGNVDLPRGTSGPPGGFLVDRANWPGEADGAELTEELREKGAGRTGPPLIATRQEGGPYRTLADLPPRKREIEIGDSADPGLAERWARSTGVALAEAGIDLNLGLIADVASLDSPVADRAFSDHAATAAAMTAAALGGCADADLVCAPGHFPGIGGVNQDPAVGPAIVSLDRPGLVARDLLPFEAAVEQGAEAMVVSAAAYAAYDSVTPAALAPEVVADLLRERLGFDGVAITDDLSSGAIRAFGSPGQAAVAAIAAGSDMVQVSDPGDVDEVGAALLEGVATGAIRTDRLEQAAGRVLVLKRRLGLLDG
jgi:beta-N-acetylhexosaminidase